MTFFAPSYYNKFKCIADKCVNNCCIGWEIDIDENTLDFYKSKEDIIKHIDLSPTPHFILKNNKCPFLNNRNLCELINKYGENNLCQICRDHPRFINCFESRTEIGIGMCCEAATELIINNDFELIKIDETGHKYINNDNENLFFESRNKILSKKPEDFISYLPYINLNEIYTFLMKLEKLNNNRDEILEILKNDTRKINKIILNDNVYFKRIFDYFVFRHIHTYGLEFCILCTYIIAALGNDIKNNARFFSSEIEYSYENTHKLLDILEL